MRMRPHFWARAIDMAMRDTTTTARLLLAFEKLETDYSNLERKVELFQKSEKRHCGSLDHQTDAEDETMSNVVGDLRHLQALFDQIRMWMRHDMEGTAKRMEQHFNTKIELEARLNQIEALCLGMSSS
ncbi:unnamed protein product [Periconia digitata]|uniref:Uncharacterized protein n=1 Tax=Periconia digitata TaxID=1303443 RepID=A0A9W4UNW2_9PLEO|nr:unnamed protein product [Periconia digitata]